jgi:lipopolysaccharide export system permease protein
MPVFDIKKTVKSLRIGIIDRYIIWKFLGTFFFAIVLIMGIAVIFDISEKIDDFLENSVSLNEIIFKYYLNFIPYFAVLFSSLFIFISVIFFTSKMAYNTEIIAILNSGMSFRRMMYPYFLSAVFLSLFSYSLSDFVIPKANRVRLEFEERYIHSRPVSFNQRNVHKQIEPGVYIYMESYSNVSEIGYRFSMEQFEDGHLVSKLLSDYIRWDSTKTKWTIHNYYIRELNGIKETITEGKMIDTTLNMHPDEFKRRMNFVETMSISELNDFIDHLRLQGSDNIEAFIIERDKRVAFPFSTFILTLIGVSLSTRKVRGGIGVHIGTGLLLAFSYILFMQFSSQFAISGAVSPLIAAWIPNILFAIIGLFLYRMAPK